MLPTVNLDNQFLLSTNEISNVRPYLHLAAELMATKLPVTQLAPDQLFSLGRGLAQLSGPLSIHRYPSPQPSPQRGEGEIKLGRTTEHRRDYSLTPLMGKGLE